MTPDLVRTVLARRPWVPSNTLLDCLDLAAWLAPRIAAGLTPHVAMSELTTRWGCPQFEASRRMADLLGAQLIDASHHPGQAAYWAVHRVGPVT
jgi:hypothetical protein